MFLGCTQLNYVKCLAIDRSAHYCTYNWLEGVASTGTFVKHPDMDNWPTGNSGIPEGWTEKDVYLFEADGSWFQSYYWRGGAVPPAGSDVIIRANATIEDGYTANAGDVFLDGGTITIENGAHFFHTNAVQATLEKGITGYGNDNTVKTGWNTIASPVTGSINTSDVENLITSPATDYDLYLYNEPTHYWWNAKGSAHPFSTFQNGQGYLYARSVGNILSFTGEMQATNNSVTVPLSYTEAAGNLKGYNLVGNPFTCNVTAGNVTIGNENMTTYLYVEDGEELVATTLADRPIKPAEGFFVQATEADQQLVFNPTPTRGETPAQPAYIRIEAGNDSFMDRAYVQIGGGNTLFKMSLNDNTPKVYVMHEGMDYAAATIATASGELPVHFKAAENGTYTLRVNVENMELGYLHLIDNMTGADIDLLQNPSYTFSAKTTDYASRFKLVFNADGNDNDGSTCSPQDNENFAFLNANGNLCIIGTGTVQVVDVLGRILLTQEITTANCQLSTANYKPGVYVLRLMNGNNVRTQKIVID